MTAQEQYDYPPIEGHGLVGNLQTAALIARDGTIDWWCVPRFDAPSVFGSVLDARRGGRCRIGPVGDRRAGRQLYFPDTPVLITRFATDGGVGEVVDFMPPAGTTATNRHRLIRMVRCVRGRVEFELEVAPRFDYGLGRHRTILTDDGAVFENSETTLVLHTVRGPGDPRAAGVELIGQGDVHAVIPLEEGQVRGVVLETNPGGPPMALGVADVEEAFDATVRHWHEWLSRSTYRGRWREAVDRSAITLKLLTYAPTGAIVAAPTAGLPELVGGERNWDYRYTWVRDASFAVSSLLDLGFTDEAAAFARWLADRYEERGDGPLKVLYRVDGSPDVPEHVLGHWEGYRGSAPVRIGNAAGGQLQLDIHGELFDAMHRAHQAGLRVGRQGWRALSGVLDWLADNWDQPDEGIWETRGGRQDFTYSRVMSWMAFDRGLKIADSQSLPAPVERWRAIRDDIHEQVWQRGWSTGRRAFTQRYGSDALDASLLRMGRTGFIAPHDPAWQDTLTAIERDLVVDDQVLRYEQSVSPDGLVGAEGTFSLCTFDFVCELARAGRTAKARLVFEKALTHANHLGLYAEELGPTGEQLGNFPQAFTHLALVEAAVVLDRALTGRRNRGESWPW
ncbi:MAG: glycoside hydrolase family 15 protein [Umezawaea sp.]